VYSFSAKGVRKLLDSPAWGLEVAMVAGVKVARAKSRPGDKKAAAPKIIGIRSSPEWADWLERLAEHYRTTVAGVIDRALAEWTEAQGYEERPPRR
jgi:hypothetical protein